MYAYLLEILSKAMSRVYRILLISAYYRFFKNIKFYSYNNLIENSLINMSIIILITFRIIIGSIIN